MRKSKKQCDKARQAWSQINLSRSKRFSPTIMQSKLAAIKSQNKQLYVMLAMMDENMSTQEYSEVYIRNKLQEIRKQNKDIRRSLESMDKESVQEKLVRVARHKLELEMALMYVSGSQLAAFYAPLSSLPHFQMNNNTAEYTPAQCSVDFAANDNPLPSIQNLRVKSDKVYV